MKSKPILLILLILTISLVGCTQNQSIDEKVSYDDSEFMDFAIEVTSTGCYDSIVDAMEYENYYNVKQISEECESIYSTYYSQIVSYDVSPKLEDEYEEFELYLYDTKESFHYTAKGADDYLEGYYSSASDNFDTASSYTRSATDHLDRCSILLEE